ncbi:MAG: choline-sulfatase [Methylobacteriaceae bacterium]|nr:choline-sulfatase [Methylobacteriaceae bacterium]
MTARPHILLVVVDQLAAQFLPCYGHRVVKAPAIDRLAGEGVVFDAFYSSSPLCAPARATLMTGALSSRTQVYDNAAEFRSSIPTFAHYLRLEGYRTCLSGKMHFVGPDQLHGFEERLTTDIYPADFGWTPDWTKPDERIDWWYHNMTSVLQAGVAEITNQLEYDDEVCFLAERKLFDHARYASEAPLCLVVSFTHPHDPYVARERFWTLYREGDIDAPSVGPVPRAQMDPASARLYDMSDMGRFAVSADDVRRSRHGYYANISYVDSLVARLRAALETCRMADDTVIMLVSDHGDFLGERGLWYKMSFREPAARAPFIAHWPKRFAPRRIAMPATLADILPTLVDLARPHGAHALPAPVDGGSLLPALAGDAAADRLVFGEYLAEGVAHPMLMARRGAHKFIACGDDPDQLFDLAADPLEQRNLAGDADQAMRVAAFKAALSARFDPAATRRAVIESQQARLAVFKALLKGKHYPWDYQPLRLASEQYTRNHRADVTATDMQSRFPPLRERE